MGGFKTAIEVKKKAGIRLFSNLMMAVTVILALGISLDARRVLQ